MLCPPDSSVSYRDQPEHTCIGGYPTSAQVAELGVDATALDAEGRCLVIEFPAFVLFGIYAPANSNGLRDGFRHGFIPRARCPHPQPRQDGEAHRCDGRPQRFT